MKYPGRLIKINEPDLKIVQDILDQLKKLGYVLDPPQVKPTFDKAMKSLVLRFQSQNVDALQRPLVADGQIGPMTWGALFGVQAAPAVNNSLIRNKALVAAIGEIGVREDPVGSNRGQRVEEYLASTGLGGGFYWCMAFVHWCFQTAAQEDGVNTPFPRTAGCIDAWNKSKANRITKAQAIASPHLVVPGAVFILDYGNGQGHTGFVRSISGGAMITVEGNTNNDGSNNGIGVFELNRRSLMQSNLKGFIIIP